jgi:hypothetical protein
MIHTNTHLDSLNDTWRQAVACTAFPLALYSLPHKMCGAAVPTVQPTSP